MKIKYHNWGGEQSELISHYVGGTIRQTEQGEGQVEALSRQLERASMAIGILTQILAEHKLLTPRQVVEIAGDHQTYPEFTKKNYDA